MFLLFALQFPLPCIVLKVHIKPFASDISILLHFCRFVDQVLFASYLSWLGLLFVYLEKPTEYFSSFASDVAMSSKFRQVITAFQWKLMQERFNFLLWDWTTFYNMFLILIKIIIVIGLLGNLKILSNLFCLLVELFFIHISWLSQIVHFLEILVSMARPENAKISIVANANNNNRTHHKKGSSQYYCN